MGWIKRKHVETLHNCPCPDTRAATVGDIWQCDTCKQIWKLAPPDTWLEYWYRVSDRKAKRIRKKYGLDL